MRRNKTTETLKFGKPGIYATATVVMLQILLLILEKCKPKQYPSV